MTTAGVRGTMRAARRRRRVHALGLSLFLAAAAANPGCSSVGPRTVEMDRFDYSTAMAESWKQQTLLNIVKLRYMDLPVFVDVASIVAGYSIQTGVTVGGTLSSENAIQANVLAAGGQVVYTDRPTITYVPLTGEKFLRGLITPIDPKNIFFMLQSGYAADFILGLTVESINGVRNRSTAGGASREADPEFGRVLQLLREVQSAGAVALVVEEDKVKGKTALLCLRREDLPADVVEKSAEIRRLLSLPADRQKFELTFSPGRGEDGKLAVSSRSMLQILMAFASYLDVPGEHVASRRAAPAFEKVPADPERDPVRIHSGKEKPIDAFAAVFYRDHWYWVDDADWQTKRALTSVVFLFTLAETGNAENLPLITIPAQ